MQTATNQSSCARTKQLHEFYHGAQPFPHFVVDQFLDDKLARELWSNFPSFQNSNSKNEFGRKGGKAVREDLPSLGPAFAELDHLFQSRDFLDWLSTITEIPNLLYDSAYIGGGTHENLSGQDLNMHVDFNYHPHKGWHRRINALLYLNPEWEDSWGGALELWKNPFSAPSKNTITKVAPIWNRLAVFATSENSWHGFEKIEIPEEKLSSVGSRKSIAVYFYTLERPPHEKGRMHSTIYFERPLPETIRANEFLSTDDYSEIERLTARRDELLQLLYKREGDFHQLSENLAANLHVTEFNLRETKELVLQMWRAREQLWYFHEQYRKDAEMYREHTLNLERERAVLLRQLPLLQEQIRLSAILPSEKQKDLFLARTSESNLLRAANVLGFTPALAPDTHLLLSNFQKLTLGHWYAVPEENSDFLLAVFLLEVLPDAMVVSTGARTLLLVKSVVQGEITGFYSAGKLCRLPMAQAEVSARMRRTIFLHQTVHALKTRLIGNRKSKFLWKLSKLYRRLLGRSGLDLPLHLPQDKK